MNKKLIVAMTVGGTLFVGGQAMANIASQQYVDRVLDERVTPIETTVSQHTTNLSTLNTNVTNLQQDIISITEPGGALDGKADLMPGAPGAMAVIDADGQFQRAMGPGGVPMTVDSLRTHVVAQVEGSIEDAVTTVITGPGGVSERLTTVETNLTTVETRTTDAITGNAALGGRVTTLETRTTDATSGNAALDDRLTTLESSVGTELEGRVVTLEDRTTNATTGNVALGGRVTTAETNITALETKTAAVNASNAGRAVMVGADGNLAAPMTMEQLGAHVAGNIDLESHPQITGLDGRMTVVEDRTTHAQTGNAALGGRVTAVEGIAAAAIPAPLAECSNPTAKCVLTVGVGGVLEWENIMR